jgi:integrase/recombinase XerD
VTGLADSPRALPLAQWPARDRSLWEQALKPADLFDEANVAASWSDGTRHVLVQRYGTWLAWLTQKSLLDPNCAPGDRVSPDLLLQFIEDLSQEIAPVTVFMCVSGMKRMLAALAPSYDTDWMMPVCRKLKRMAIPVREKHLRVVETSELYALGVRLLDNADAVPGHPMFGARQARDGLIISLLAARPLRLGNFTVIELGRHLRCISGSYWLVFDKSETKNGRPIEMICPDELVPHIERYRHNYRPVLLARATTVLETARLWIGSGGRPMGLDAIRSQIEVHTRRAFGRTINPHLFRDCAATSVAVHDPEHVRIASVALGHAWASTTEKYYNQAQMLTASREHHREIIDLRSQARSWRSRRHK